MLLVPSNLPSKSLSQELTLVYYTLMKHSAEPGGQPTAGIETMEAAVGHTIPPGACDQPCETEEGLW